MTILFLPICTIHKPYRSRCFYTPFNLKFRQLRSNLSTNMASLQPDQQNKLVWIWTENKEVMTASVERGWTTFLFGIRNRELANEWQSIALINPIFIGEGEVLNGDNERVATFSEISSPEQLRQLQPDDMEVKNIVVDFLDWQVIPAENIVAAFQVSQKTVLAVSKSYSKAKLFLEALEQGVGGVVLKVEDVASVFKLKDYIDSRNNGMNLLSLTTATITKVEVTGMGDRVCVDLCSLMRPGEGLLVGSFARGLFLVHSECVESNYIASRPFRVNAGPVHAYVAVPGGKTSYLSELETGKEVVVADQSGLQRTAIVGRIKIEKRPLILVEAKSDTDMQTVYSILLQNAETVSFVCPGKQGSELIKTNIPVTSLKVGDNILLGLQGEARHTGIEIKEFIIEK